MEMSALKSAYCNYERALEFELCIHLKWVDLSAKVYKEKALASA